MLDSTQRLRLRPLVLRQTALILLPPAPCRVQLAREHAAALEALEEAEFELREVEQFQQLARVTG